MNASSHRMLASIALLPRPGVWCFVLHLQIYGHVVAQRLALLAHVAGDLEDGGVRQRVFRQPGDQ